MYIGIKILGTAKQGGEEIVCEPEAWKVLSYGVKSQETRLFSLAKLERGTEVSEDLCLSR